MSSLRGLSPRRRIFTVGLALLLAAAVAAVVAGLAFRSSASDSPARSSAGTYPPQDRLGPVLLVPGYGGNTGSLSALASRIRATGRRATVVHLPANGTGSLVKDAAVLGAAANRALRHGAPSVDVIGYSAGGVAALIWARDYGGVHVARRIVTLGSPFHGAQIAGAAVALVPGACPTACQQLAPGSTILKGLDATPLPARPPWLSLWSTTDSTVTPPDSARLAGAVNVPIQSVCPGQQISHSQLPTSPVVSAMVLKAIGTGPLTRPRRTLCRG
ncbi:MAG TPA: alpha/beta hydrolase [Streptosporangiaceae bacterium]|jgi:uncharacterized alpha/beta hydrolase family protein|nr:alpha/beta hydrolase [Streptosporangiaceae bacterium]